MQDEGLDKDGDRGHERDEHLKEESTGLAAEQTGKVGIKVMPGSSGSMPGKTITTAGVSSWGDVLVSHF